jgi:hypothetical protein
MLGTKLFRAETYGEHAAEFFGSYSLSFITLLGIATGGNLLCNTYIYISISTYIIYIYIYIVCLCACVCVYMCVCVCVCVCICMCVCVYMCV